jgi:hypothetical protein
MRNNKQSSVTQLIDEIIESHPEVMCVLDFWENVKKEIELL